MDNSYSISSNAISFDHSYMWMAIMDMYKYDDPVAVFEGLQIMEVAAMEAINKEAKK